VVADQSFPKLLSGVSATFKLFSALSFVPTSGSKLPTVKISSKWLHLQLFLKRLPGVGSEPGSSRFHLLSHFHHFTAEPQRLPMDLQLHLTPYDIPPQGLGDSQHKLG
jgi:hypothetical protein